MTNKGLQNLVNGLVDVVIKAKGFNPAIGAKGGEREMAQSLVGMAIKDLQNDILGRIPGLTAEAIRDARESLAVDDAAAQKDLKIAKTA